MLGVGIDLFHNLNSSFYFTSAEAPAAGEGTEGADGAGAGAVDEPIHQDPWIGEEDLKTFSGVLNGEEFTLDISNVHHDGVQETVEQISQIILDNKANTPEGRTELISLFEILKASCNNSIALINKLAELLESTDFDAYTPEFIEAIRHVYKHYAQVDQQVITRLSVLKEVMGGLKFIKKFLMDWIKEDKHTLPLDEMTMIRIRLLQVNNTLLSVDNGLAMSLKEELSAKIKTMIDIVDQDLGEYDADLGTGLLPYYDIMSLLDKCSDLIEEIRILKQEARLRMQETLRKTLEEMYEIRKIVNYDEYNYFKNYSQLFDNTILTRIDDVANLLAVLDGSSSAIAEIIPLVHDKLTIMRNTVADQVHALVDNPEFAFSPDFVTAVKEEIPLESSPSIEKVLQKLDNLALSNPDFAGFTHQMKFLFNGVTLYAIFSGTLFQDVTTFTSALAKVLDLKIEHATAVILQDKIAYEQFESYFGIHIKQYYQTVHMFSEEEADSEKNIASRELLESFTYGMANELGLKNMKITPMAVFAIMHHVLGCDTFLNTLLLSCPQGEGAKVQLVSCSCPDIKTTPEQYGEMLKIIDEKVDAYAAARSTEEHTVFSTLNLEISTSVIAAVKTFLKEKMLDMMVVVGESEPAEAPATPE